MRERENRILRLGVKTECLIELNFIKVESWYVVNDEVFASHWGLNIKCTSCNWARYNMNLNSSFFLLPTNTS